MKLDLLLFGWPLLCLLTITPSLGLLGAQVLGRQQALQVLCIAQGAIFGHVLADWFHMSSEWLLAWTIAFAVSVFCDFFNKIPNHAKNAFHVCLYIVLLSLTYLLVSLVPSMESHALNQFFGDVVLVSEQGAQFLFGVGLASLILLIFFFTKLTRLSFEIIVLETKPRSPQKIWLNNLFKLGLTFLLTLTIQYLGLLYCLGALTIIPLILAKRNTSLQSYFKGIIFISIFGSFFGFLIALQIENVSTTPVINLSLLLCAFILRFTVSCASSLKRSRQ